MKVAVTGPIRVTVTLYPFGNVYNPELLETFDIRNTGRLLKNAEQREDRLFEYKVRRGNAYVNGIEHRYGDNVLLLIDKSIQAMNERGLILPWKE